MSLEISQQEIIKQELSWGFYGEMTPLIYPYDISFQRVLNQLGFNTIIEFVISRPLYKRRVLDLMGPLNSFIDTLNYISQGTAFTYADIRSPELRDFHERKGLKQINGDIGNKRLWYEIGIQDVISCRSAGGLSSSNFLYLSPRIIFNSIERLDADGGLFLFEYNWILKYHQYLIIDLMQRCNYLLQDSFRVIVDSTSVAIQRINAKPIDYSILIPDFKKAYKAAKVIPEGSFDDMSRLLTEF